MAQELPFKEDRDGRSHRSRRATSQVSTGKFGLGGLSRGPAVNSGLVGMALLRGWWQPGRMGYVHRKQREIDSRVSGWGRIIITLKTLHKWKIKSR